MPKGKRKGKNKVDCQKYTSGRRGEINQYKRLIRHLQKHPGNQPAIDRLKGLAAVKSLALKELKEAGFAGRVDFA